MTKFEFVSRLENPTINLPMRKTVESAGYDFEVAEDIVIPPMSTHLNAITNAVDSVSTPLTLDQMGALTKQLKAKPTLVPTGVKCHMDSGTYLELSVRSSCPLKYWLVLANGVGIIDADYYNNPDNEGEIFFQIINLSPVPIQLHAGDIIGQGIINSYGIIDDDEATGVRTGGFGSTSV